MSWLYDLLPVYTFSALLGVVELTAAVLLKDVPLLGLSFWSLADAIKAVQRRSSAADF
jgi:hypothetical protein